MAYQEQWQITSMKINQAEINHTKLTVTHSEAGMILTRKPIGAWWPLLGQWNLVLFPSGGPASATFTATAGVQIRALPSASPACHLPDTHTNLSTMAEDES